MSVILQNKLLITTIIGTLALCALGSCASGTKSAGGSTAPSSAAPARFGGALEAALAAQIANPEATDGPSQPVISHGERIALAQDNYRKGTTKALVRESTSSTKNGSGQGGGAQ
jgi:hypothetical protein